MGSERPVRYNGSMAQGRAVPSFRSDERGPPSVPRSELDAKARDERSSVGRSVRIGAGAGGGERSISHHGVGVADDGEHVFEDAAEAIDVVARIARPPGHSLR